ncbi:hypothetical protein T484DRAFT_1929478 [Baffinella frigidus]|nr:hypothetical protein T484DRAFT_1929478 [Cryptophyta sp. CCMP2293]
MSARLHFYNELCNCRSTDRYPPAPTLTHAPLIHRTQPLNHSPPSPHLNPKITPPRQHT